jgi:hypothetical protein
MGSDFPVQVEFDRLPDAKRPGIFTQASEQSDAGTLHRKPKLDFDRPGRILVCDLHRRTGGTERTSGLRHDEAGKLLL